MELLTKEIACTYRERAKALPYNGMQDIGERRALRKELQARCGLTELEAANIINGFHIEEYCKKYLIKQIREQTETQEPEKKKKRRQYNSGYY